ncbi:cyclic peptide export ABC transporter [Kordiimonas pumila]|uniref:Cyclic peptide export ABC transporter n=1 Tax=Kordiimonas pumila TaxID=2161677 RepID=A0ABV7D2Y9_9PROT|nr:cyclic peptide export ABC transporter [Kordiimonas pumila]
MHILRLLRLNKVRFTWNMLYVTVLAGLASAVLLALVNTAAERTHLGEPVSAQLVILYLITFGIFYVSNQASLYRANQFVQSRLNVLRNRIASKIQKADLRSLEQIEHGNIYSVLSQEMNHFSHHFTLLSSAAQSAVLLVLCLGYIALLSFAAFVVVTSATVFALFYFWRRRVVLNDAMVSVNIREAEMLGSLQHYTEGFQEIRLNADKSDALHAQFQKIINELEEIVVGVGAKWVVMLLFSNAFLYALVGVVIFILPLFFQGYTDTIYKIVTASIFLVGPVSAITSAAPMFVKANIGLGHVFELEESLEKGQEFEDYHAAQSLHFNKFKSIRLEDIKFRYHKEKDGFQTGPWTLEINRGDCIFLMGGNGSGKSTAFKLICGLYQVSDGKIYVDDVEVIKKLLPEYRSLFSCIFPDFYLFDELYGLRGVSPEKVNEMIKWMQLEDKVTFQNNRFSTQDLSSGQRKRLALIVSMLEDREIYLLDEWAADQDAHFRELFYVEILPKLKAMGKTVLVITHDDRYWHVADRSIHLETGKMREGAPKGYFLGNGGDNGN